MAAVNEVRCKRKLSENESNTSNSNSDFDSDDSVKDQDYVLTTSSSGNEYNSDLSEHGDKNVTKVCRGAIATPEKPGPSRWRRVNNAHRKKYKSAMKRNLGYSYISSRGKHVDGRVLEVPY